MYLRTLALLTMALAVGACSSTLSPPVRTIAATNRPIPGEPRVRAPSLANEILEMTFGYQIWQVLDTPRIVRKLTGHPYQALNVDNFDEVPNTTWFTNRNGVRAMSIEEIRRGPDASGPPDSSGPWRVVAIKSTGVTPGLTIVDVRGNRYIIKFDAPDFKELASGTEAVAAKLLYGAGYNVPENYITYLEPANLVVDPDAVIMVQTRDKREPLEKRPLTQADLQDVLSRASPDGQPVRVLASKFLHGTPIGPFRYTGIRNDDPNDIYSHEHRREIRGLYVIASWINHADMKEENTLDMYDPETGLVDHYLIDFGAAMGSNSVRASNPRRGQANSFDLKDSLTRFFTLGLFVHDYEKAPHTVRYPSVGYLVNDLFEPEHWKPMYPCPAFENATKRDLFWGAKIVTSFTDEQLEAVVSTGEFSDPAATAHLLQFLTERRDRIGRYWFARMSTLDRFAVDGSAMNFQDLAVQRGYAAASSTTYQYRILQPSGKELAAGSTDDSQLMLSADWQEHEFIVASVLTKRAGTEAKPVLAFLRPSTTGWQVVGLRRLD
jgi:hypothetical protein